MLSDEQTNNSCCQEGGRGCALQYSKHVCGKAVHKTLSVGDKIPAVPFEVFYKEEIQKKNLSDSRGKWLVLFFYPGDFTFVCPTELEELAGLYENFKKEDAEVFSVSCDSVHVHKAWHDTSEAVKKVTFPMAADPTAELARLFGTYIEDEGVSLRGSFIIDPEGVVRSAEINDNSIGRSASELLRRLQAAKFVREHDGLVCPASWKPGDDNLKPGLDLVGKI